MTHNARYAEDHHRRRARMRGAAATAAIMAVVTFAVMFLFDQPWLGTTGVVISIIAGILARLGRRREPPSKEGNSYCP